MPRSKFSDKSFTQECWLVTVINTTRGLILGHSAIVVEGVMQDGINFIGQYDISANSAGSAINELLNVSAPNMNVAINALWNVKGIITRIRAYGTLEEEKNTIDYEKENYPRSNSYEADPQDVFKMISSIKEDKLITEKAWENKSRLDNNQSPIHFDNHGVPITHLKFQRLGANHPWVKIFGDDINGDNCASYCEKKLEIVTESFKNTSKPPKPSINDILHNSKKQCSFFYKHPRLAIGAVAIAAVAVYTATSASSFFLKNK